MTEKEEENEEDVEVRRGRRGKGGVPLRALCREAAAAASRAETRLKCRQCGQGTAMTFMGSGRQEATGMWLEKGTGIHETRNISTKFVINQDHSS